MLGWKSGEFYVLLSVGILLSMAAMFYAFISLPVANCRVSTMYVMSVPQQSAKR